MIIKAGGGRRYDVFLRGGREKVDTAFAVWALWNGGPGYRIGRVTVRPID